MKLKLKRNQFGLRYGNVALFKEIEARCGIQSLKLTGAAELILTWLLQDTTAQLIVV